MASLEAETIREALRLARGVGAETVELRVGEDQFTATFGTPAIVAEPSHSPEVAPTGPVFVRSANVGYFHPLEPPIEPGTVVNTGKVIGIVESLGLANDVVASAGGAFVAYLVEDGAAVEFGQAVAELSS